MPRIVAVDQRIARRVNALRPSVKQRLERVVAKLPQRVTLLVTSARRTRAEQASLKSTFGVKARPGTSPHEDGRAIDVNVLVDGKRISPRMNNRVIGVAMASEGFRYLGAIDPVHYSVPKEGVDRTLTKGPAMDLMTIDEMLELKQELAISGTAPAAPPASAVATAAPLTAGVRSAALVALPTAPAASATAIP